MKYQRFARNFIYLAIGIACGQMLHEIKVKLIGGYAEDCLLAAGRRSGIRPEPMLYSDRHNPVIPPRSNIYLGMMSASKYVSSRVQRALDTWLQKGGWKIEIFADAKPSVLRVPSGVDAKIVTLPSVDDTAYPPQKKCFMMIRHMYDYYKDDFDWFMRVDDDVYMDYPHLSNLLNKINSSKPIYFGSPGFGMDTDDGMENGMVYLMGGPGIIMSRGLLTLLRSKLGYCIRHMYSPHEDVEIGRCVWRHIKDVIIPVGWEGLEYFYQQYDKENQVTNVVLDQLKTKRIAKMSSYHAVKTEPLMYALHKFVMEKHLQVILKRSTRMRNEINAINALLHRQKKNDLSPESPDSDVGIAMGSRKDADPSVKPVGVSWLPMHPSIPRFSSQVPWTFWDKYYRHQADTMIPFRGHHDREQKSLLKYVATLDDEFLKDSCPGFPKNARFLNGYLQATFRGFRLMTSHIGDQSCGLCRCLTHLEVSYGLTLLNEDETSIDQHPLLLPLLQRGNSRGGMFHPRRDSWKFVRLEQFKDNYLPLGGISPQELPRGSSGSRIVLIIPLEGRYRTLERFMESYEKNFLIPTTSRSGTSTTVGNIQLVIVLFEPGRGDDSGINRATIRLLQSYQKSYNPELIRYHTISDSGRKFSRGAGLQLGSLVAEEGDIVFFMDIDMIVTPELMAQCRRNVVRHKTAWYPVPYSQYDPDRLCYDGSFARKAISDETVVEAVNPAGDASHERNRIRELVKQSPLTLEEDRGFWRDFGFGIACFYKSDFLKAGGFDLTIEGWGEEDIRLYVSLVKSGLDVFRAKQSDLIHIFHPKYCDSGLVGEQARACKATRASHFAGQRCLARTYIDRGLPLGESGHPTSRAHIWVP